MTIFQCNRPAFTRQSLTTHNSYVDSYFIKYKSLWMSRGRYSPVVAARFFPFLFCFFRVFFSGLLLFLFHFIAMSCGRMNKIWTNSFSVSTVYDVCLRNQRPSLQTARFLVWLQTCRLLLSASLFNDTTAHSKYHPINCGEMCENTPFSILNVSHIWYRWSVAKRKFVYG